MNSLLEQLVDEEPFVESGVKCENISERDNKIWSFVDLQGKLYPLDVSEHNQIGPYVVLCDLKDVIVEFLVQMMIYRMKIRFLRPLLEPLKEKEFSFGMVVYDFYVGTMVDVNKKAVATGKVKMKLQFLDDWYNEMNKYLENKSDPNVDFSVHRTFELKITKKERAINKETEQKYLQLYLPRAFDFMVFHFLYPLAYRFESNVDLGRFASTLAAESVDRINSKPLYEAVEDFLQIAHRKILLGVVAYKVEKPFGKTPRVKKEGEYVAKSVKRGTWYSIMNSFNYDQQSTTGVTEEEDIENNDEYMMKQIKQDLMSQGFDDQDLEKKIADELAVIKAREHVRTTFVERRMEWDTRDQVALKPPNALKTRTLLAQQFVPLEIERQIKYKQRGLLFTSSPSSLQLLLSQVDVMFSANNKKQTNPELRDDTTACDMDQKQGKKLAWAMEERLFVGYFDDKYVHIALCHLEGLLELLIERVTKGRKVKISDKQFNLLVRGYPLVGTDKFFADQVVTVRLSASSLSDRLVEEIEDYLRAPSNKISPLSFEVEIAKKQKTDSGVAVDSAFVKKNQPNKERFVISSVRYALIFFAYYLAFPLIQNEFDGKNVDGKKLTTKILKSLSIRNKYRQIWNDTIRNTNYSLYQSPVYTTSAPRIATTQYAAAHRAEYNFAPSSQGSSGSGQYVDFYAKLPSGDGNPYSTVIIRHNGGGAGSGSSGSEYTKPVTEKKQEYGEPPYGEAPAKPSRTGKQRLLTDIESKKEDYGKLPRGYQASKQSAARAAKMRLLFGALNI